MLWKVLPCQAKHQGKIPSSDSKLQNWDLSFKISGLALLQGLNNYQYHVEAYKTYLILQLSKECGTIILVVIESPTVRLASCSRSLHL